MKKLFFSLGLGVCCVLAPIPAFAQKVLPKVIKAVSPGYPKELINTGFDGVAEVDVLIKADGSIGSTELGMAVHRAFGKAAMAAITDWQFSPGSIDGVPTEMKVSIPFRFTATFEEKINALARRQVFIMPLPGPVVSEKEYPKKKQKVKVPPRVTMPRALANQKVDIKVDVSLIIAPDGTTLNPVAKEQEAKYKALEQAAVQAVALMSFEPCVVNGKPAYVEATVTLQYYSDGQPARGGGGFRGEGGGGGGGDGDFGGGGGRSRGGGGGGSPGGGDGGD